MNTDRPLRFSTHSTAASLAFWFITLGAALLIDLLRTSESDWPLYRQYFTLLMTMTYNLAYLLLIPPFKLRRDLLFKERRLNALCFLTFANIWMLAVPDLPGSLLLYLIFTALGFPLFLPIKKQSGLRLRWVIYTTALACLILWLNGCFFYWSTLMMGLLPLLAIWILAEEQFLPYKDRIAEPIRE